LKNIKNYENATHRLMENIFSFYARKTGGDPKSMLL